HVRAADGVSPGEGEALLAAARGEGKELLLVLERATPRPGDTTQCHEIAIAPLAEGDLRRLLEHALPGARITAALVRDALAASSGLAGRLCSLRAQGSAGVVDMSRGPSLRALAAGVAGGDTGLPGAARALAELLCV